VPPIRGKRGQPLQRPRRIYAVRVVGAGLKKDQIF
jgi:hypothetical protein